MKPTNQSPPEADTVRGTAAGWKELVRWILSWQPDVKVLAPKRLRERIETKMMEALGVSGIVKNPRQ